jgi:glycosyltransferase involved in cell wall biosynthesis
VKPKRIAVIPTRNRTAVLKLCVEAISNQADAVIVVDNGDVDPVIDYETAVIRFDKQPPNLSHLWNLGLGGAQIMGAPIWDVAILNDDAIVPEGWFDAVATKMREMRAAAACSGGYTMPVLHTQPGPVGLATRMQGYAFVLRGELGLRANEDLHWYFTDDYLDWESRKLGGMVMVPGFHVQHLYPNQQMTPELHEQVARDAQTFVDLYGMRPW